MPNFAEQTVNDRSTDFARSQLTTTGGDNMIFQFGRYTLDVDVEKTKAFYDSNRSVTTDEACSCARCQLFPHAIMSSSDAILKFLRRLGIDPRKPGEVFGYSDNETDRHQYSGWYHIVGTLREGKIIGKFYDDSNAFLPDINAEFRVWFEDDPERMGWIEQGFPVPILEMSFSAILSTPKA